jgi:formate dehydrogenase iron-sulfur subunit
MRNPQRYVNHIYGEHEAGGTSWMYISPVPFEYLGFPTNIPKRPLIEEVKGFLGAVPVVFTVWPALFGMVYAAVKHRDELFKSEQKEVKK